MTPDSKKRQAIVERAFRRLEWCHWADQDYAAAGYNLSRMYDKAEGFRVEMFGKIAVKRGLLNKPVIPHEDLCEDVPASSGQIVRHDLKRWYYPKASLIWAMLEIGKEE